MVDNNGFWKNKRVLVTGATGFVGAWLCKKLLEQEAIVFGLSKQNKKGFLEAHGIADKVSLFTADIVSSGKVKKVFEKTKPEYCFHLAAISSQEVCEKNRSLAFSINVTGSKNVFESCSVFRTKVVFVSSAVVYGKENVWEESLPLAPQGVYASSKAQAEAILLKLVSEKSLVAVIARPSTVFGPMDSVEKPRFFVNNILLALKGKPNQNDPCYVRDFVFVTDAIDAFLKLAEKIDSCSGMAFNVSQGESFLGPELGKEIVALVHGRKAVLRPLKDHKVRNTLIFEKTGWKPKYSLLEGILETIAWCRKILCV